MLLRVYYNFWCHRDAEFKKEIARRVGLSFTIQTLFVHHKKNSEIETFTEFVTLEQKIPRARARPPPKKEKPLPKKRKKKKLGSLPPTFLRPQKPTQRGAHGLLG
jgi:hypothetical protein